jgi:tRNA(fMet)-specific endonuclease VapC
MTAFDSDILSELLDGNPVYTQRAAAIDPTDQLVPAVVAGEVLRGRLNAIRQAEGGRGKLSLELAYGLFVGSLTGIAAFRILPYTSAAEALFKQWRAAKIRVGSQDLRIAAICIVHGASLVTRNARDYIRIPGLSLDVWS